MSEIDTITNRPTIINLPALRLESADGHYLFNGERLDETRRANAVALADSFDINGDAMSQMFGSEIFQRFNMALDKLLEGLRIEDLGKAGDIVLEAGKAMDTMKLKKLRDELQTGSLQNFLAKIPLVGKYLSVAHYFVERKKTFETLVHNMERNAVKGRYEIIEAQQQTSRLIDDIIGRYDDLGELILAGELILQRGVAEYEALSKEARETNDAVLYTKANRLHENLVAFDTRVLEFKIAYTEAPVSAQQLEMANAAGRMTLQNIQNMLDFILPRMKIAVFQAANLYRLDKATSANLRARDIEKRVSKAGREMLGKAIEDNKALQKSGLEHAQNLQAIVTDVIALVEKSMTLDEENAAARREAETILNDTMHSYKNALAGIRKKLPKEAAVSGNRKAA